MALSQEELSSHLACVSLARVVQFRWVLLNERRLQPRTWRVSLSACVFYGWEDVLGALLRDKGEFGSPPSALGSGLVPVGNERGSSRLGPCWQTPRPPTGTWWVPSHGTRLWWPWQHRCSGASHFLCISHYAADAHAVSDKPVRPPFRELSHLLFTDLGFFLSKDIPPRPSFPILIPLWSIHHRGRGAALDAQPWRDAIVEALRALLCPSILAAVLDPAQDKDTRTRRGSFSRGWQGGHRQNPVVLMG